VIYLALLHDLCQYRTRLGAAVYIRRKLEYEVEAFPDSVEIVPLGCGIDFGNEKQTCMVLMQGA
jgi:hypothetical protein